jgi:hypothetical protein
MKEKSPPKIISITQANGWVAVFANDDGTTSELPVAVWAIIEDGDGYTRVSGMSESKDNYFDEDDGNTNFVMWRKV